MDENAIIKDLVQAVPELPKEWASNTVKLILMCEVLWSVDVECLSFYRGVFSEGPSPLHSLLDLIEKTIAQMDESLKRDWQGPIESSSVSLQPHSDYQAEFANESPKDVNLPVIVDEEIEIEDEELEAAAYKQKLVSYAISFREIEISFKREHIMELSQHLTYAFFIMLYSTLEERLNSLCENMSRLQIGKQVLYRKPRRAIMTGMKNHIENQLDLYCARP